MGASAQEIGAPHRFSLIFLMVVVAVVAVGQVGLEAGEMLVDDQVDDTGHGVGAPGGGSAARHHIHPLDDAAGDGGKVHAADRRRAAGIGVRGHHPLAVEQHQGADHAQGAQIDGVNAGVALRGVTGVRTVARGVASAGDRGKFADGVADTHLGIAVEGFDADHRDRGGGFIALDLNAGRGDRYRFRLCGILGTSGGRSGSDHGSHRAAQHELLTEIFHYPPRDGLFLEKALGDFFVRL